MQVELTAEQIFRVRPRITPDDAEVRAWAKRVDAFGALSKTDFAAYLQQGFSEITTDDLAAATGEGRAGGSTFEALMGKAVDPMFLLDIGAEAVNTFIPGVNLAKMVIVKGSRSTGRISA